MKRSIFRRMSSQNALDLGFPAPKPKRRKTVPRPRPAPKPIDDIEGLPAGPRVIVPYPAIELSPNWTGHWAYQHKAKRAYRQACWALGLEAKLKVPEYAGADGEILIRLDFFPPNRNSRDDDNAESSFKAGRDGIADALKVDDARFTVVRFMHEEPRSCVVVTLITPEGGAV